MGAVCHTVNPRLAPDDIAFIMNDAADALLFADPGFAPLVAALAPRVSSLRAVVLLCEAAAMQELPLSAVAALHAYGPPVASADEDYAWPEFDENPASQLC